MPVSKGIGNEYVFRSANIATVMGKQWKLSGEGTGNGALGGEGHREWSTRWGGHREWSTRWRGAQGMEH